MTYGQFSVFYVQFHLAKKMPVHAICMQNFDSEAASALKIFGLTACRTNVVGSAFQLDTGARFCARLQCFAMHVFKSFQLSNHYGIFALSSSGKLFAYLIRNNFSFS